MATSKKMNFCAICGIEVEGCICPNSPLHEVAERHECRKCGKTIWHVIDMMNLGKGMTPACPRFIDDERVFYCPECAKDVPMHAYTTPPPPPPTPIGYELHQESYGVWDVRWVYECPECRSCIVPEIVGGEGGGDEVQIFGWIHEASTSFPFPICPECEADLRVRGVKYTGVPVMAFSEEEARAEAEKALAEIRKRIIREYKSSVNIIGG